MAVCYMRKYIQGQPKAVIQQKKIPFTYGEHEQAEEYLQLHRAIATLSKKLRITLTLFYFKDYTVKEISEILNIPEGTVKSRLNTARRIIKRRLENEK